MIGSEYGFWRTFIGWYSFGVIVRSTRREIMTMGPLHELISRLVSGMLEFVSDEWNIDITDLGTTPFKPIGEREFMPDGSWYINMDTKVNDRSTIDLATSPPPDISLETDISTNSSDKLRTFAKMRVPEVWLYNLNGFAAKALENEQYVPIDISRVIAGLPIAEVAKRLDDEAGQRKSNMLNFRRAWRKWLQEHRHLHDNAS